VCRHGGLIASGVVRNVVDVAGRAEGEGVGEGGQAVTGEAAVPWSVGAVD